MRIGMLLMGGTYPPDIRVEKEASVLSAAGHEVFLLTTDRDGGPPAETVGDIRVRRYPARAGFVASKSSAVVNLATWNSPLWKRSIAGYVASEAIDVLHVHDLPAVRSAVSVAREVGIPVVFDMHENYTAAVGFWPRTRSARLFQTPARYRSYERWAVNAVDRVVCVVDEAAQRVRELGASPERVVVFGNVDRPVEPCERTPHEGFVAAYAGGFGPHRGLETLVRAMPELTAMVPGARLVLMGGGTGEGELRELVVALGLRDEVEFTGWVDEDTMRKRLCAADVGTVPHVRNDHTDSTVPHKLFQYMAMGLPVVVSDCAPLARIVTETGAGRVFESQDSHGLACALAALADPAAAGKAANAGLAAVADRYNLEREGERLLAMYAGIGSGATGRR